MLALIGLGNPGAEYAETRHNVGFMVVDRIAHAEGARFRMERGEYLAAHAAIGGHETYLVKPMTYMNNSGQAVSRLLERTGMTSGDLFVIVDDFHLPLGAIRIRRDGSHGGHNGLRSVINALGTNAFTRMRCGIGGTTMPSPGSATADYVLSPFDRHEHKECESLIVRAADAASLALTGGIERAIQQCNRTKL